MDHSKDVLALLENMQNQIHTQEQQILEERQQRQQLTMQAQQLSDELHEIKAITSKKPLTEKSPLMKNIFIFITFLYVCETVFVVTNLVGSFLGFQDSLALQLVNYFFSSGLQAFSLTWFVCFAPSPKWLLSLFICSSLFSVVETIVSFVTVNVIWVVENVVSFIIYSLLAWQYQSVWRTLSARPLEQETPSIFLSLLRIFVYLSIPIFAISIRDQQLNEYAGSAIFDFSATSLGLVMFVRLKIRNNETLLQLLFRLNYKEQVFFCFAPIGYAIFLIHYLYYLSKVEESSGVQLCLAIFSVLTVILFVFFFVGTVSKWRYLSWFDTDSPVAAESSVELSQHLDHVTIDF